MHRMKISDNSLTSIPTAIKSLSTLTFLQNTNLKSPQINSLSRNVGNNDITSVATEIGKIKPLVSLFG